MIVSNVISWQPINWPAAGTAATQYAIFQDAGVTPSYSVTGGATSTLVSYDDSVAGTVFIIRPTDGTSYGPSQTVVIAQQPLNHRADLRSRCRKAIGDRYDNTQTGASVTSIAITDDELNQFLNDAIREYSLHFPREQPAYTINLVWLQRSYDLPADFLAPLQVRYTSPDQHFEYYLRQMPFKGGETTASSWIGYPKLGLLQPPIGGRFYPGHYEIHPDGGNNDVPQITLDFDPPSDQGSPGTLMVRYAAPWPYPSDDLTPLPLPDEDIEMILIYMQGKVWLQIESKDVRLSRWRTKDDGGSRKDLPTEVMSARMFKTWTSWVNQRRTMRPRTYRLVRH